MRDSVRRAISPGDADRNLIICGADDLGDVLVGEPRTEQDGFDVFLPEQTHADFKGFALVFYNDHIELIFSGLDEATMFFLIGVRSMGNEESFENEINLWA